ncbi:unnamed protein product [Blumeria hordei]|uniref:Carboxylic ester hydrolase n=2 Tax=Blumeria hordei TaxID=2867405 RepID=A0A383UZC5_BLUHO|nr:acetylcholinesterase precursor/carboxylesterase [Blumeria hordei DH14]SZF05713.1 unnamed protein product [Blumeria hordei]
MGNGTFFTWLKEYRMKIAYAGLSAIICLGTAQALYSMRSNRNNNTDSPTVDIGYAVYRGYYNHTTDLNVFNGIRFAAPPTGALRWQRPQEPQTDRTTHTARDYAPRCPQANHGPKPDRWFFFLTDQENEDCLFLNVMGPVNASSLPVMVWMHGGGYGAGDGRYDFAELINTNNKSLIVVSIQYRLGAFGYLSSDEFSTFGVPNAGLYDQQFALEWVQQHIFKFGGDPTRVTIAGESAGGGAVMQQMLAYGGTQGTKYFSNVIAASPYLPMQWPYDGEQPTIAYNAFIKQVGCAEERGNASVPECLNSKDTYTLQNASAYVSACSKYGQWAFLPVVDGSFIQKRPTQQLLSGKVNGLRVLSGHNSDEAPAFVPQTIKSDEDFEAYTSNLFPLMNNQTRAILSKIYEIPETVPGPYFSTLGSSGPTAMNQSSVAIGQQQRANNMYAESTFVCPSYWLADALTNRNRSSWKYQFSVPPAAHGADLNAYYEPNRAMFGIGTLTEAFRKGVQLSWGRFITTGDPTLPISLSNNITNSNSSIERGDDISAATPTSWPKWQRGSMPMLNLNMSGGVEVRNIFWVAAGVTINVTKNVDPGLRANWSIVDAGAWEGGRGRRCNFWAEFGGVVPE